MNAESFVRFRSVSKRYGSEESSLALGETSFSVGKGEFVCIVGPSGCGKTTLLNMLAGFVPPTGGVVEIEGKPVREPGPDRGVVFQDAALFDWLTAQKNVEFGLKMANVPRGERQERARKALELVKMGGFGSRFPSQLSGGMKQRVGIARALVNDPQVLLMDEPFAALDAQTRDLMQNEILRIWGATRKTIFFVTHSIDEALFLADRIIVMSPGPGRIVQDLRPSLARPRDETSADFNELKRELKAAIRHDLRAEEAA